MKKMLLAAAMCYVLLLSSAQAQDENAAADGDAKYTAEDDIISYALGYQVGQGLKTDAVKVNMGAFMDGINTVLEDREMAVPEEQLRAAMMAFGQRLQQEQAAKQEEQKKLGDENLMSGAAFLEENAKKEGVKVTESGLQYKVVREGTGATPSASDTVKVNYRGQLLDGTQFDSSYDRGEPAEFPVGQLIKGWTEALQMMKVGGNWELWIPASLAYGERGRPGIPPNSVLHFEMELLDITGTGGGGTAVIPNAAQ